MSESNRQIIIRRLLYLRNWEFINIFFLPVCLFVALTARQVGHWQPYGFSMFAICAILAQGTIYWHLKLQTITKREKTLPAYFLPLFSLFKWADVVMLAIYPILTFFSQATSLINFQATLWSNLMLLFAGLEYINYFYYQLSHDNMSDIRFLLKYKKIRRSPLFMDMQKTRNENLLQIGNTTQGM